MLQQLVANGLIAGSIYALVALGFGLIYSTTHFFHFAHGTLYTWGAYITYLSVAWLGLPLGVSIFLSILFTSLLGVLIEVGIYRPLRRREATDLVLLLTSLGIFVVLQNVVSLIFGDDTKTIRSGVVQEGFHLFGARITPIQGTILVVTSLLFIASSLIWRYTKVSKTVRAVANDPGLAKITGIDTELVIMGAFGTGSALAAIAAMLVSLDVGMTPIMGLNALMMAVVAVIVGGVGSIPGAALGGLFVGLAQHLGVLWFSTQWQDAIVFVILILFLLLRPQGFLGKPLRRAAV